MTSDRQKWIPVGVSSIDQQHSELFAIMDRARSSSGDDREEFQKLLESVEKYIVQHFSHEEKYMLNYKYPDLAVHRAAHVSFMKDFAEIKVDFHLHKRDGKMVEKLDYLLNDWWIHHVALLDKKLGDFLVAKSVIT